MPARARATDPRGGIFGCSSGRTPAGSPCGVPCSTSRRSRCHERRYGVVLARRVGLVLCGIVLAASGAAGVLNGAGQWRTATPPAGRWLGPIELLYGVTGFAALWGLLHPGRWMWPVFGAWAVAVIAAAGLGTVLNSETAGRWLTHPHTVGVGRV